MSRGTDVRLRRARTLTVISQNPFKKGEMEAEHSSTTAKQSVFAVAKLKWTASLPRMKDGGRPPMHVDGVSKGKKNLQMVLESTHSRAENQASV